MNKTNQTVWAGLLGLAVRAGINSLGAILIARGVIDQPMLDRLLSEGTGEIVGAILVGAGLLWGSRAVIVNFLQKHVALLSPSHTTIEDVQETVNQMPVSEKLAVALTPEAQPPAAEPFKTK